MQNGDISNDVPRRTMVVFEGLLGVLPTKKAEGQFSLYRRTRRYTKAAGLFELNRSVVRRIWDLTWRFGHATDAVTFLGDQFVEPLLDLMDGESLPIGHLISTTREQLARDLPYRPDIVAVYDPVSPLTYGSKAGRHPNPSDPNFLQ